MAKRSTNKSALIREYLGQHKGKSPSEISGLIKAEKGLEIPPAYVSNIKGQLKGRKKARKLARTAATSTAAAPDDRAALFAAAKLVVAAGGIDAAREALNAVAKVADTLTGR